LKKYPDRKPSLPKKPATAVFLHQVIPEDTKGHPSLRLLTGVFFYLLFVLVFQRGFGNFRPK